MFQSRCKIPFHPENIGGTYHQASPLEGTLTLSSVQTDRPEATAGLVSCLVTAFSSGVWGQTPMPVGAPDDPGSALGVINSLSPAPVVLAAYKHSSPVHIEEVVGCVLGAILDHTMIEMYGLEPYAAVPGDGLLAFIGIVPSAQGLRVLPDGSDSIRITGTTRVGGTISLARHLFEKWIHTPRIQSCPRVFIRTREQIAPVIHLCESLGFEYCGRFELDFCEMRQERLVFRLSDPRRLPQARPAQRPN